jgi:hypothetical protein
MRIIILIGLGLAYAFNSVVLGMVYPNVSNDYDQYIAFIAARNIIYECMFAGFFLLSYLVSVKLMKAISCFFLVLSAGSVIDKGLFGITQYLKSDIILIIIALTLSFIVYVRENKR